MVSMERALESGPGVEPEEIMTRILGDIVWGVLALMFLFNLLVGN